MDSLKLYYDLKQKYKSADISSKTEAMYELVSTIINLTIVKKESCDDELFKQIIIALADHDDLRGSMKDINFNFFDGFLILRAFYNYLNNEVIVETSYEKKELEYLFENIYLNSDLKKEYIAKANRLINETKDLVKKKYPDKYLNYKSTLNLYTEKPINLDDVSGLEIGRPNTKLANFYSDYVNECIRIVRPVDPSANLASAQQVLFNLKAKEAKEKLTDIVFTFTFIVAQIFMLVLTSILNLDRLIIFEEIVFAVIYRWESNNKIKDKEALIELNEIIIKKVNGEQMKKTRNIFTIKSLLFERILIIGALIYFLTIMHYSIDLIIFTTIETILLLFVEFYNEKSTNKDFILSLLNILICGGVILTFTILIYCNQKINIIDIQNLFKFQKMSDFLNVFANNVKLAGASVIILLLLAYFVLNEMGLLILKKNKFYIGSYLVINLTTKTAYGIILLILLIAMIKTKSILEVGILVLPICIISIVIYNIRKKNLIKKYATKKLESNVKTREI